MDEDEVAGYPGLYARNGSWYVRKRTPVDLTHVERRASVRVSLETSDRRAALARYPFKMAEIETGFARLREELRSTGKVEGALQRGRIEHLSLSDIERMVARWWRDRRGFPKAATSDSYPLDEAELRDRLVSIAEDRHRLASPEHGDAAVQRVADRLLVDAGAATGRRTARGISAVLPTPIIDRQTEQYRALLALVRRGLDAELVHARESLTGRPEQSPEPIFIATGGGIVSTPAEERRVGGLVSAFRNERIALYGMESTDRKYGLLFRAVEEVLGRDFPTASISREHAVALHSFLKALPPNVSKRFPGDTLKSAVERARAAGLTGLAPNTVSSYMQNYSAVLRWGQESGWGTMPNTRGLITSREPLVSRRGFRPDELTKLFDALAPFRRTEPAKYWVPALALYTGARANELCQLQPGDIIDVRGVKCLNLSMFDSAGRRVPGKRLKTRSSERYIPLHHGLLDAGFAEYVGEANARTRLFDTLALGPDGRYSHGFSKWFGRFRRSIGFGQPALVFHSFRHGFRDACRVADIPEEAALALGGWAHGEQAHRYGDRGMVEVLDRAMRRISFGDFHLPR